MLLLVLALFMIITSEWPRFGGSRVPAGGTIRVVSWNIGSGFGGWAEAVAPLKPDVVLVQESAAWRGRIIGLLSLTSSSVSSGEPLSHTGLL